MSLEELNKRIKQCTRCVLRENATAPVCGIGQVGAKYLIVGEAPGQNEDKAGVPFVGLAGKRLDKLLALAKIDPNACYITNICRCRPPANRTPRKAEMLSCLPFFWEEIKLVRPESIITLGATPLSLFSPHGVKQMHGTMFEWELEDAKV